MRISYKPLWHTLVECNMRKEDLRLLAELTTNIIAGSVLLDDSVPVRLQGTLDDLINGLEKETSLTELAESLSMDGAKKASYEILEGGGTA